MKKRLLTVILSVVVIISATSAQDVKSDNIILKSGDEISALVKEITPSEVKYVNADNLDGPLIVLAKQDVFMIQYSNGTKEVIGTAHTSESTSAPISNNSSGRVVNSYKGRTYDNPSAEEYTIDDLYDQDARKVYYGIDFALVRLVGSSGFKDPAHIVDNYFSSINQKIVIERDKYDFSKVFWSKNYDIDLEMLADLNRSLNPYEIVINSSYSVNDEQIKELVANYNPKNQEGIGLAIVMETWNKFNENAIMYFTFFDIKTRKVIKIDRKVGRASGFGIRNYWMNPVYDALKNR